MAGRDTYVDTTNGGFWYYNGGGAWMVTSSEGHGHGHDAAQITSGVLGLTKGGTNQSVWMAGQCVQVSADGTRLESAAGSAARAVAVRWRRRSRREQGGDVDDFLSGDKTIASSIGTPVGSRGDRHLLGIDRRTGNHPGIIRLDSTTSTTSNSASMHLMRTAGLQRAEMFDLTWIFRPNQADGNTVVRA
ncbi:MAG: hypothetical protein IPJ98_02880, partial [Bryobacterales bacterium]|nr:hypothetical protein [Bryobacterales bacterium]